MKVSETVMGGHQLCDKCIYVYFALALSLTDVLSFFVAEKDRLSNVSRSGTQDVSNSVN